MLSRTMETILIAGCGYVGVALAARLAGSGHTVWGLRRNAAALPPGVRSIAASLTGPDPLPALPARFDAVYYLAGADAFTDEAYRAAYVDGPARLLAALQAQGQQPRRVIFASSTGVYAQQDGAWLDESSPAEPQRFSGRRLIEGERLVQTGPYPGVVLRLGGIYGPGRSRLVEQVRQGSAVRSSGTTAWLNLIHRDDCAGALQHLLNLSAPDPVYLGVDHEPWDKNALLSWIAAQLALPDPPIAAPADTGEVQRGGNRRFRNARLCASGYAFRYPSFRDGFTTL